MQQVKQTSSASGSAFRHAAGPDRHVNVKPVERHVARRVKRLTAAVTPEQTRLKQVEDALLGALMDVHSNRDRALDRLLVDIGELPETCVESDRPAPLPADYVDNDFDGLS